MLNIFKNFISNLLLSRIYTFLSSDINSKYVLMKKSSKFPNIKYGSDLDILTLNLDSFIQELKEDLETIRWVNLKLINKSGSHIHINFYFMKFLILKLDLIDTNFNLMHINEPNIFLKNIFTNSENYLFRYFFKKYNILIPNIYDEIVIRINELETYPHKHHHEEYINLQENETLLHINNSYARFLKQPIRKYI